MTVYKWNDDFNEYDSVEIPDEWNVKSFSLDMDELVNCVCCGNKIKFGDAYTSRHFHTKFGMGFAECSNCYFKQRL